MLVLLYCRASMGMSGGILDMEFWSVVCAKVVTEKVVNIRRVRRENSVM